MKFFDLNKQYKIIKKNLSQSLNNVLERGDFIIGKEVITVEEQLASFSGSKYCIGTSSGTDALILSLMCLDIKSGDEVITPAFSYIASAEAICLLGAVPVFVDVDIDTFNIDVSQVEKKITKRTKAIMPVSLYGQPYNYNDLNKIAKKYKIPVIEDASQSFGSSIDGVKSTNLSDIGCTSFFPTKPLGCYGDGGAIFTNNEKYYKKFIKLRSHGQPKKYTHDIVGLNARLDTLQAAVLIEKLSIFNDEINKRQFVANLYRKHFEKINHNIQLPVISNKVQSVYAQFTIKTKDREKYIQRMLDNAIPYAIHYPKPIPSQKAYKKYANGKYTVSDLLANQVLSLPFHPYLKEHEIKKIVSVFIEN
jgi:UDP-2-acetamido-2-deoxy-ribo-hexuluronate aminotransferase